jgi:carbamoyltransferase
MRILGISAFYHDSAAALTDGGVPVFAAQEERYTRIKNDPSLPVNAIKDCLAFCKAMPGGGLPDAVVFYDKPFLKFERLLETYCAFAPLGFAQFARAVPVWCGGKLFIKQKLLSKLRELEPDILPDESRLLFSEHHLSHAASAFYPSPYNDAAILTLDGVGEWATSSLGMGRDAAIEFFAESKFPHSLGLLYAAFTAYAGFHVNSGEYKLMGLAPYGEAASARVKKYRDLIFSELADIKDDGSLWLNQDYFEYARGLRMADEEKWTRLFGLPPRRPPERLKQEHCDLAMAAQQVTEEVVLRTARTARKLSGSRNLCMAGGVALNCVANSRLAAAGVFENIWVQPAAGDAGGALGAALAGHHIYFGSPRHPLPKDAMSGAYLGPEFGTDEIAALEKDFGAQSRVLDGEELYETVARLLADGAVLGWCQGRMEWGPRALGNRSILADPRRPEMQNKLNMKIKFREGFRPFAPAVLAEDAGKYFVSGKESPYMLFTDSLRQELRRALPENMAELSLDEKRDLQRSDVPAVTHLDYSARLQTVAPETNPRFHKLLLAFKRLTGCSMLLNTSFNVRGEPIVRSPADAYSCFMSTGMDYLVIGDRLFDKQVQPPWRGNIARREESHTEGMIV